MRVFLVLMIALAAVAGCLDESSDKSEPVPTERGTAPHVDAAALVPDLRAFAETHSVRLGNRPDHEAARVDLLERFASFGLETYRFDYDTDSLAGQADIIGIKWGTLRDQWIVVGAHYDIVDRPSCPAQLDGTPVDCPAEAQSQGMYDDGSGTMMTVYLAEAFANVNTTYTMAFVAFDGEELGLQGSGAFAETFAGGLSPYGNLSVHAMLDLDMFGLNWPSVDAPIYFDSNSVQLDDAVRAVAANLSMPAEEIKYQGISLGRSDYAHFFALNVPTGFFISSFEEYQAPGDVPADAQNPALNAYPFWHRMDTWETMMLMAGSEADVIAGFQTAVDLASGVLWFMDDPTVSYQIEIED